MLGGTPDPWPAALVGTQTPCSHFRCAAWGDGAGLALATPASDPCSERSTFWAGLTFDSGFPGLRMTLLGLQLGWGP